MPSFESIYRATEENVRQAVERFKSLKSENAALRDEVEKLRAELEKTREKLSGTEEKLKLVGLAGAAMTKEDAKELKKQIGEWVREIDNSIRILEGR